MASGPARSRLVAPPPGMQRPGPANYAPNRSAVSLRYTGSHQIQVRGPVSGRAYQFSGAQPLQSVDARDAGALLQTNLFRRG